MSDPESGFIRHKLRQVCEHTITNLGRLDEMPGVLDHSRPLEGRTVVVVGAGPSLEGNGEYLVDAQARGIPIIAVNASDSACRAYGVKPDVMLARESLDIADQIEASDARMVVVDISVRPDTWDAARDRDGEARWFIPVYPRHVQVCRRLGIRPMYGGTSALCSAVSLAMVWGAARIVLVGVDLAGTTDGRVYHRDAPRGTARAHEDRDTGALVWTDDDADADRHLRSGQPTPPREQAFDQVPSMDWGDMLPVLPTWQNQREWLTTEAGRRLGRLECINATEGGGGIVYWRSQTLRYVLAGEDPRDPVELPGGQEIIPYQIQRLREDMAHDANAIDHLSESMLEAGGPSLRMLAHLPRAVDQSCLVEATAAKRILDAPQIPRGQERSPASRGVMLSRCRYIYESWQMAAQDTLALLEAGAGNGDVTTERHGPGDIRRGHG